jgi:hypothetical protein
MKPLTEERRAKVKAARFNSCCSVVIFGLLMSISHHAPGWRFKAYTVMFALSLGVVIFRWFQLRQAPPDETAAQG